MRKLVVWVAILFLIISCGKLIQDRTRVQRGKFLATMTETGELQALVSKVIAMPIISRNYGDAKIVGLAKEGIKVKQGDWVGQIDTTGVIRYLVGQKTNLAIAEADLQKMIVQNESDLQNLQAQLASDEAALRQAQIDTQRTKFEAPSKQEIARLQLKIAEISYKRSEQLIEHTRKIQQEDLLVQKIRIKQIQSSIQRAENTLDMFCLRAPGDGIVEYKKLGWHDQVKVKVGDEPHRGEPIIGLPDLAKMKAQTTVNEADIGKIAEGQEVRVRLDAFPSEVFKGKIIYISKVCREKEQDSRVKVFDVDVLLEKAKSICLPGMTVSCEIVTSELEDVLFVNNKYLQELNGKYVVYVHRGGKTEAVPVTLGPRNATAVVVSGDLKSGEKLVDINREEGA